jgi:hypothetical protein
MALKGQSSLNSRDIHHEIKRYLLQRFPDNRKSLIYGKTKFCVISTVTLQTYVKRATPLTEADRHVRRAELMRSGLPEGWDLRRRTIMGCGMMRVLLSLTPLALLLASCASASGNSTALSGQKGSSIRTRQYSRAGSLRDRRSQACPICCQPSMTGNAGALSLTRLSLGRMIRCQTSKARRWPNEVVRWSRLLGQFGG